MQALIGYARDNFHPVLVKKNTDKLADFYKSLRKYGDETGGIQVGIRHFESIIRIAESHAKTRLAREVSQNDIDVAIRVMLDAFILSQRKNQGAKLEMKLRKYLFENVQGVQLLVKLLNDQKNEIIHLKQYNGNFNESEDIEIKEQIIEALLKEKGAVLSHDLFKQTEVKQQGYEYDEEKQVFRTKMKKESTVFADI